jgi:hypothetical protein
VLDKKFIKTKMANKICKQKLNANKIRIKRYKNQIQESNTRIKYKNQMKMKKKIKKITHN